MSTTIMRPNLADGTWASTINGEERRFYPTLDKAIFWALKKGEADLTRTQAAEYINRFKGRLDNVKTPTQLMREIFDCDPEECGHNPDAEDAMCFTDVQDGDFDEDWKADAKALGIPKPGEYFVFHWNSDYDCYRLWRR
jgi:hypothetical protein